jgi:hypothetical protein
MDRSMVYFPSSSVCMTILYHISLPTSPVHFCWVELKHENAFVVVILYYSLLIIIRNTVFYFIGETIWHCHMEKLFSLSMLGFEIVTSSRTVTSKWSSSWTEDIESVNSGIFWKRESKPIHWHQDLSKHFKNLIIYSLRVLPAPLSSRLRSSRSFRDDSMR